MGTGGEPPPSFINRFGLGGVRVSGPVVGEKVIEPFASSSDSFDIMDGLVVLTIITFRGLRGGCGDGNLLLALGVVGLVGYGGANISSSLLA